MKTHALTDIGCVRPENQDVFYTSELPVGNLPNLFVVADGMGGHVGGKQASHTALSCILDYVEHAEENDPASILNEAIIAANEAVKEEAKIENLEGMGTTAVCATVIDDKLIVANVGDSRLYLVTPTKIKQITQDHSWVEEMVRLGKLDRKSAKNHKQKNVITRAIGITEHVEADIFVEKLPEESNILICSDGLTNMVEDDNIFRIVNSERDVIDKTEQLITKAKENGGKDNITVIVIEPNIH